MSLRRIIAEAIEPDVRATEETLRKAALVAEKARQDAVILLLRERREHTLQRADWQAELDTARADVARLLEDAHRCAEQHSKN